jgi:hypothetical protein
MTTQVCSIPHMPTRFTLPQPLVLRYTTSTSARCACSMHSDVITNGKIRARHDHASCYTMLIGCLERDLIGRTLYGRRGSDCRFKLRFLQTLEARHRKPCSVVFGECKMPQRKSQFQTTTKFITSNKLCTSLIRLTIQQLIANFDKP